MKKLITIFCLVALVLSLFSCARPEPLKEEDVKPFLEEYLKNLEEENYEALKETSDFYEEYLKLGFLRLEDETGLDFQSGIEIVEYKEFDGYIIESYYGIPLCSFLLQANIGGKSAELEIQIVCDEGEYKTVDIYVTIDGVLYGIS